MGNGKEYDELSISQVPALEEPGKIGYTAIPPEKAKKMRGNLYNVLLKDILYNQLKKLNSYEYRKKMRKLSTTRDSFI